MDLRDLAPTFLEQHPDPLLFVSLAGVLLAANPASARWLRSEGLSVGDPLPPATRQALLATVASGAPRGTWTSGDAVFDVWPARGEPAGLWLQARAPSDPAADAARAGRRAKASFLAHANHDLRTPLNAILGYSGLLREERPDDLDLQRIEGAAHQLLGLVDQLLEVSRMEAGAVGLFPETFALGALADALRAHGLAVTCAEPGWTARGDVGRIRQVLTLLADRARRAGHPPAVTLRPGLEATLTLTGAPASVVESLRTPDGAEGLAAALVDSLLGLLGGTVTAEAGALRVRLPVEPRRDGLDRSQVEIHGPDGATTVLVVDDDDASRDLLRRQLLRAGYRVLGVRDGELGLRAARELRPDVITLDIVMPRMNGWEVLRRLKDDAATRAIPVVVVSIIDAAGSGFAVGASGFLTKPIDRGHLLRTLDAFRSATPRALVVDDDPNQRALVNRALSRAGWVVEEAGDGARALEALERSLPDVLLLDLFMPVVDGFAVVEAVRARPEWRNLPIVVVTALDLGPAEHARLADRVHAVVAKSATSVDRLLDEIRAVRPPAP